jgi:hypothetical protein
MIESQHGFQYQPAGSYGDVAFYMDYVGVL